jgi:streptomycin 6-kinase
VAGYADHPGLSWLRTYPGGPEWLAELPGLIAGCLDRWRLRAGRPFGYALASLALPVRLPDGADAVLKVQFPHPEAEHEAVALAHWAGEGAVRLLAHDPDRHALLLERCRPGTPLTRIGMDAALAVYVDLLPRLWRPAGGPFRSLADQAQEWADDLPALHERAGRPVEPRLVERAVRLARDLARSQRGPAVLLHQDLHADNVLRARRQPWLAIDPKPLVGERDFGAVPVVRGMELGHSRAAVLRRFDQLCEQLELDRERVAGWTIVQTLAWSMEGPAGHLDVVRWLAEAVP